MKPLTQQDKTEILDKFSKLNNELVTAQRELAKRNEELKRTNEQLNEFLGMAAHDLRNPVAAVFSICQILKEELKGKVTDEYQELLDMMAGQSEATLTMMNSLLDLSKVESGKLSLDISTVNTEEFIKSNVKINNFLAARKGITIEFNFPGTLPPLQADPIQLEQIINNLLSNAIKFSNENTIVEIMAEATKEHLTIIVKDHGQGIPEDELKKIFSPYELTTIRSTDGEKNTGLGLAIVNKIVKAHKGQIWAKSTLGEGTTFYVKLPLIQSK